MKRNNKYGMIAIVLLATAPAFGQKVDEDRMRRDIEVGENVLSTLIKQEVGQQKAFFGMDVKGSYQPGYGVTFRLPGDMAMPFVFHIGEGRGTAVIAGDNSYTYSITTDGDDDEDRVIERELEEEGANRERAIAEEKKAFKLKEKAKVTSSFSSDSLRTRYNTAIINAATNFILDYGDFMSQLPPTEKIVVTNQGERHHFYFNQGKRTRISVEGTRQDITAFRQGKMTRDQAAKKLVVVNTESVEAKEPDMEMLSSIFSRLYRPDLSKTYFSEGNVYYERLKDYGAIFYMQVYSSNERGQNKFNIPTLNLDNLDKEARDKKVTELYPAFEQDLKENVLEYGRTVKSIGNNEVLAFQVTMTKCTGCGIPSSLEVSIPGSVLSAYGSGKMDRSTAMTRFTVKKGAKQ